MSWSFKFSLLLCFLLNGCGYTLSHRLKDTFTDKKGIFVPVFANQTQEVGAERVFTNALIRELQSRGEITMTSRDQGGLELFGTITAIEILPTAWTDRGLKGIPDFRRLPSELSIEVRIELALNDPAKGEVWRANFSGRRKVETPLDRTYNYQAPSSLGLLTQSLAESRYADIARDIVRDVYDEMVQL